jgi:presenilin-like A22 family membrane protease
MDEPQETGHELLPIMIMAGFFILIPGIGLLLTNLFSQAGLQAFTNTSDPFNLVIIFAVILGMTLVILLIAKFWKKQIIHAIILFAVGYTTFYVLLPLLASVSFLPDYAVIILSILIAVLLVLALWRYPEWWVIDLSGILVGAGAIAIFGISLSILLVLILLIALAVYDAISVYKTKHMIDLADTVMDLKLPVLLVVPKIPRYSLIKETRRLKEQIAEGGRRDAFFMGLGDVVMPGILVAAIYFTNAQYLTIALATMLGTIVGFGFLMLFVIKGKPQAGLPLLNSGAILGYIISSLLLYGTIVGLSLPSF